MQTNGYDFSGQALNCRVQVQHVRDHMEAFYEHGSAVETFVLATAFDLLERGWQEQASCEQSQASLIEALLAVLGIPPRDVLKGNLRKRPTWPI
jgi:hypothetical protein